MEKPIFMHLSLLIVATTFGSASAMELLANPRFEDLPFPSSWTAGAGTVSTAGLNGSSTAARLPYSSSASLSQTTVAAANFTFDVCFNLAGTNEAQSFRMVLAAGATEVIDLRVGKSGVLEIGPAFGAYSPLVTLSSTDATAIPVNQTIKLRIIGRDFDTDTANYDVIWTSPYTTPVPPPFSNAALNLRSFAAGAAGPIDEVKFERNIAAANSFTVDELSFTDAAVSPGITGTHLLSGVERVVNIHGVYPHLTMTNSHDECGVGAVVPWAGKLWVITYGPHVPNGGSDKLYEIAPDLSRIIRSESVGGTPANRFIHGATNQLNIGPYFIDADRKVRVIRTKGQSTGVLAGRFTATAAHLSDPNRLYLFTMEDGLYDVDARDLSYVIRYPDVQGSGDKFLHGYHAKGAYTGQGLFVATNNGRNWNTSNPSGPGGVLATWDGVTVAQNGGSYLSGPGGFFYSNNPDTGTPQAPQPHFMAGWNQVSLTQHCEATGPGGIHGNPNPTDPVWSTGFDAKSVLLHVMENQQWQLWRLPKASYTHDGSHGWHTEWPRIRQLDPANPSSIYLMHMHGLFYDFPRTFSASNFAGLRPISSYYKMPTDYCTFFDGRIVMGRADASRFDNPLALKDQSNLWFGTMEDIENWGAPSGHGAVWMNEAVAGEQLSEPFFINGFPQRTLHLKNSGATPLSLEIQTSQGTPTWTADRIITVPSSGYVHEILSDLDAQWVRFRALGSSSNLTAFFHMGSPYPHGTPASVRTDEFSALADIRDTRSISDGVIRVMNDARLPLEFASSLNSVSGEATVHRYHRIAGDMSLRDMNNAPAESALRSGAATSQTYQSDGGLTFTTGADDSSAWIRQGSTQKFRLPKLDPLYEAPFAGGWARTAREAVTERQLLNLHGTFYEYPRDVSGGVRKMRALTTHGKRITDFTSWRGLLVMTGVLDDADASDTLVKNDDGTAALWLGEIDQLWRMGEPRGTGGPWKNTPVAANGTSDPYLMYGYDRKELTFASSSDTTLTVEVDFLANNTWSEYQTFTVTANIPVTHHFPAGFHAHWVRLKSSAATTATAQFIYGPADARDRLLDWARDHGLRTGGGRTGVFGNDSDGDSLPAIFEYLLGTDPGRKDSPYFHTKGGPVFETYLRNDLTGDAITCRLEISDDLITWTPRPDLLQAADDQSGTPAGFTRMRASPPPGWEKCFFRLRAALP
jgi:hypothetical protein